MFEVTEHCDGLILRPAHLWFNLYIPGITPEYFDYALKETKCYKFAKLGDTNFLVIWTLWKKYPQNQTR